MYMSTLFISYDFVVVNKEYIYKYMDMICIDVY